MPRPARARVALALALFVASGATSLVYQVLWFEEFALVWGNSSLAAAAVLAGFLLGLGLGAECAGRFADRLERPLLAYAACELAIAVWALLLPRLLAPASELARLSVAWSGPAPAPLALARAAAAFLVLAPPCAAMGATLPLLVRALVGPLRGLGRSTAALYATNTAGAAAGAWLGGFHLLPALGIGRTRALAVAAGLGIAVLAAALGRRDSLSSTAAGAAEPAGSARPGRGGVLAGASFLAGAAGLALEVAWHRELSLVLGGTSFAFTAMLTVVLAGLAAGSALLPLVLRRGRDPRRFAIACALAAALLAVAGQRLVPGLAALAGELRELRARPGLDALIAAGASAAIEFLPALLGGVLFPAIVALSRARTPRAGRTVGHLYAWNVAGTTVGAIGAHLFLLPLFGVVGAVLAAALAYPALVVLLVARPRPSPLPALLAVATGALVFPLAPRLDPRVLESGQYLYGPAARKLLADSEVLMHRTGRSANVLVTRLGGVTSLRINGKVDASTAHPDQLTQLGSAILPLALVPGARRVLVIGYGSGVTAGTALLFPGTEVTCVEIEAAVLAASEHFHAVNHAPERSPGFRAVIDDGRAFLAGSDERFDLLITEPSNPWMAGVASLFTREFYRLAERHLSESGLLVQWIQTYALDARSYLSIVRTVREVLPHGALFRLTSGDTLLVAARRPVGPSREALERARRRLAHTPLASIDLALHFETTDAAAVVLEHLVLADAELDGLLAEHPEAEVTTDDDLRLAYEAPRALFRPEAEPGAALDGLLLGHLDPKALADRVRAAGADERAAPGLARLAERLHGRGHSRRALAVLDLALELAPGDEALTERRRVLAGAREGGTPRSAGGSEHPPRGARALRQGAERATRAEKAPGGGGN